jgi:hypothetical protein
VQGRGRGVGPRPFVTRKSRTPVFDMRRGNQTVIFRRVGSGAGRQDSSAVQNRKKSSCSSDQLLAFAAEPAKRLDLHRMSSQQA